MRRFIPFNRLASNLDVDARGLARLQTQTDGIAIGGGTQSRSISFVLSDESVARDGHTIATKGWELDNFYRNPVVLWAHDSSQPPIGRMTYVTRQGSRLVGTVEFADAETYPFAETIFKLLRGGFLNAVSVSWMPLEWVWSKDKSRPGGVDFLRQELLEVSVVPVPALPTAIATARSAGIDVAPLVEWERQRAMSVSRLDLDVSWKCSASRTLQVVSQPEWNSAAAAERIFAAANFGSSKPNAKWAAKAFVVHDPAQPTKRASYQLPIADVVDGRLVAVREGIEAAEAVLHTTLCANLEERARAVLDAYKQRSNAFSAHAVEGGGAGRPVGDDAPASARSLGLVSWLAYLLQDLACLVECVEWETEHEGTDPAPASKLSTELATLGQLLVEMTQDAVTGLTSEDSEDADSTRSAVDRCRSTVIRLVVAHMHSVVEGENARNSGMADRRAGKILSSASCRSLEDIHAHMSAGCDMIRGFIDGAAPTADDEEDAERSGLPHRKSEVPAADRLCEEQAVSRLRKARALQRKIAIRS
jgi:HK97 family phage prohead protease